MPLVGVTRLPGDALQRMVYQALKESTSVAVYDAVPEKTPPPYITLRNENGYPWFSKTFGGLRPTIDIHIWTSDINHSGSQEMKNIEVDVMKAFAGDLVMDGNWKVISAKLLRSNSITGMYGRTAGLSHGILTFEFLLQDVG